MEESVRHRDETVSKQINMQHTKCRRPPEVTLHASFGRWVCSRMGASRGYTAAKQEQKSRTSTQNPNFTLWQQPPADNDTGNKLHQPPGDRAWRKDYRLPSRSSSVCHVFNPTSLWGHSVPQLCYPLRHKTPPGLAALALVQQDWWWKPAFRKCMAIPRGVPFCFRMLPLFSEKPKPSQSLLHAWGHWFAVVPTASASGLLGQLVQVKWPCSDPHMQVL